MALTKIEKSGQTFRKLALALRDEQAAKALIDFINDALTEQDTINDDIETRVSTLE